MVLKMPKQFPKYLCYFCNECCCRKLSKITQSGHAAPSQTLLAAPFTIVFVPKKDLGATAAEAAGETSQPVL